MSVIPALGIGSKRFFFEKKKQKTFALLVRAVWQRR
jgi:hypothetical protein